MALTRANMGSGSDGTAATTVSISPTTNFNLGASAILCLAYDNAGTQGADPYSSIADATGNTWTVITNVLNDPGAASAGATLRIFKSDQTVSALTTSSVITVTFSVSVTAKAWTLHQIESDTYLVANPTNFASATQTTATPSITTTSITSGSILLGVVGGEGNGTRTGDSDTTNGSWDAAQSAGVGATTSGIEIISQTKRVVNAASTNPSVVQFATGNSGGYVASGGASSVATLPNVTSGNLLVVAFDSGDRFGETNTNFTISSSPALTWTLLAEPISANSAHCKILYAYATSSGSHTITTFCKNATNGGSNACVAYEITGMESTMGGAVVTAVNQTAPSVNITTTLANSIVIATYSDWNAIANTTYTYQTGLAPVTNTLITYWASDVAVYNYYKVQSTVATVTHGFSSPTGQSTGVILAEIRGTGGTTTQTYNPTLSASDDLCIAWVEFTESATLKPTTSTQYDPFGLMGYYGI